MRTEVVERLPKPIQFLLGLPLMPAISLLVAYITPRFVPVLLFALLSLGATIIVATLAWRKGMPALAVGILLGEVMFLIFETIVLLSWADFTFE